ncbi:glutamate 5-kinase [Flavonifractor sp. An135]|nr:glutamate 5-kinase [Flavonifractor sp. An135]
MLYFFHLNTPAPVGGRTGSVNDLNTDLKPQRIVVKVGTSTLTRSSGSMNLQNMEHLTRTLADLKGMGHEIILVSSGAIGVGTKKLRLEERPTELRMKQATAAVGQCMMMHLYDKLFSEYNRTVAQILLTGDDVEDPIRAEHLSSTFSALLELGVIPVVNENDSVSSAEIETGRCKVLGDNDTLSAIVARLCKADLLVLLSDIDGLYDADPRTHPDAKLIHHVSAITPELRAMAGGAGTWRGTGGMATKLHAAQLALDAGIDMVISNGARMEELYDIVAGKNIGTRFSAKT